MTSSALTKSFIVLVPDASWSPDRRNHRFGSSGDRRLRIQRLGQVLYKKLA